MKKEEIDAIVIHCSATPAGKDIKAADIEREHKKRGFKCIGYNYVIDLDGTVEVGRPLTMDGAHCNTVGLSGKPYNKHSVGICYVGGLDAKGKPKDTRTKAQRIALNDLVWNLFELYDIKEIIGHRDASPDLDGDGEVEPSEYIKACPCFDVKAEFPIAVCEAERKSPTKN